MHKSTTYIVGNWKMNADHRLAEQLAGAAKTVAASLPHTINVVLCPPAVLLADVCKLLDKTKVKTGGQDCHPEKEGAFTGDISAAMLKEAGCSYVITGHSERRANHHETNHQVHGKAMQAMAYGLVPIVCVGETQAERDSGRAMEAVGKQVAESLPKEATKHDFLLAYEPVWAIGSGKTPTTDDIAQMHRHIMTVAAREIGCSESQVNVLYGGSVKAANAREILTTAGVAGVLVGGASLKPEEFDGIIAAAAALKKG